MPYLPDDFRRAQAAYDAQLPPTNDDDDELTAAELRQQRAEIRADMDEDRRKDERLGI